MNRIIITLDGPAGAGKSTVAKQLAKLLNISYLDTGAMYRALTLKALRLEINMEDEDALKSVALKTKIEFVDDGQGGLRITLDGEDVSEAIRSLDVTNNTFYTARAGKVREILVEWQKAFGRARSLVGEGRDLGTVVFPEATYKFYLDADVEERCQRRIRELRAQGKVFDEEALKKDLRERDQKDLSRAVGPLKKTTDMIVIDSTGLSVEQTAYKILEHIN
ncbi:MAG: (d)CMP kinase [Candidatus Omnitrophica bacterium]|nr:(d)CMP kinase [Candidatus Omnitrophota bacterium]